MSNSYTINSEMNNNNNNLKGQGLPPKSPNHYNSSNFSNLYSTTADNNYNKSGYYVSVSGGIDNNSNQRKYI
jgi:hypothetical protein